MVAVERRVFERDDLMVKPDEILQIPVIDGITQQNTHLLMRGHEFFIWHVGRGKYIELIEDEAMINYGEQIKVALEYVEHMGG